MEDIKVGDYVRTKNNGIKRIDTIFKNKTVNKYGYESGSDFDGKWYSYIKTTEIVKHSKNIIDLIKIVDVLKIKDEQNKIFCAGVETDVEFFNECIKLIKNKKVELLSIVTKEQFKNMSYEV